MSGATTLQADDLVLNVLRRATIDATGLTLPEQLERKTYQAVDKFLKAAGVEWNKKAKRHLFADPGALVAINDLLGTGQVVHKKNLRQAFYTPDDVAAKLVQWADVRHGHVCLEPSAGAGVIAKYMHAAGGLVTCVDIEHDATRQLEEGNYHAVFLNDFLDLNGDDIGGPFDRIVMNPPFARNQCFRHVLHAYGMLAAGGKLVAVLPHGATPTAAALATRWDLVKAGRLWLRELPDGTFKSSGTGIRTEVLGLVAPR